MSLTTFLQQCPTGISLGGAYALIAIGYTLVCGILRLINSAHGNIFMMAEHFIIFVMVSLPWFIAVPVIPIMAILLDVAIERVAYRLLRSTPRMSVMISAIGVSYLLQNLAIYLFTVLPKGYPEIPFLERIFRIDELSASFVTLPTPVLTLVLVYLLILLINHTRMGMAMGAVSKDYEAAPLMSTKVDETIAFTSAMGLLLAGTGSVLCFIDRMAVFPFSGALPGLGCFVAAVSGGVGDIPGAVVGGFTLGFREAALVAMGQSTFSDAFMSILLIVMLLIRPTGLFGERATDKV